MCQHCDEQATAHSQRSIDLSRRQLLINGATLTAAAAVPWVGFTSPAMAAAASGSLDLSRVTAWGVTAANAPFTEMTIERRQPGPKDVVLDILYSGICHSDIHSVNQDWGPAPYPVVPGHEIVGRVVAVGDEVTRFRVGDIGGVGCMVDSCGECENCLADREQNCLNGTTFTYSSRDKVSGGLTQGGYSQAMVVTEKFVLNIPEGLDLSRVAPILCAGITTFSPIQHWQVTEGMKVGVIGIGGLGHMAVKLAVAKGAEVTAFTTSEYKLPSITAMGAKGVYSEDSDALGQLRGQFDILISTVPYPYNMQRFMGLMKLDATLVNVGQLGTVDGLSGMMMGFGRHSLAGSMIGGIAETQEVINFCAEHNILPDVELIRPDQIDAAYTRVRGKDIQYRFVIDMQSA